MNELTLYTKNNWQIRSIVKDGEPWFVAKDVIEALTIGNITDALARLDEDEKGFDSIETLGGKQQLAFVTESGLYSLVLGSRKPEAKEFKRWITHEVLPAIRKTGVYSITPIQTNHELGLLTKKLDLANAILQIAADPTACALASEFFGLSGQRFTSPTVEPAPIPVNRFAIPSSLPPITEHRARQKGGFFFAPSGERLYTASEIGKLVGRDCHAVGAAAKKLNMRAMPGAMFWDRQFPRMYFERGRDYLLRHFGRRV